MQYQKRGYIKTYDENGNLLSKVLIADSVEAEQDETPAEEDNEVA